MGRIAGSQDSGERSGPKETCKVIIRYSVNSALTEAGKIKASFRSLPGFSTAFRNKAPVFTSHSRGHSILWAHFFPCRTLTEYLLSVDRVDIFSHSRPWMGLLEVLSAFMAKKVTKIKLVTFIEIIEKGFLPRIGLSIIVN